MSEKRFSEKNGEFSHINSKKAKKRNNQKSGKGKEVALLIFSIVFLLLAIIGVAGFALKDTVTFPWLESFQTASTASSTESETFAASEPTTTVIEIKFSRPELKIVINQYVTPEVLTNLGNAPEALTLTSSDENIVTIEENTRIKAAAVGTAVITAKTLDGLTAECSVNVMEAPETRIRDELDPYKPMVALTFDDGPNGECTRSVMATLEKYNGKSTFFMVGTRVSGNEELVREVYDAGHEIGSHSYDHSYANTLTTEQQQEEIDRNNDMISNAIGRIPALFRCPGGISCEVYENNGVMPIIQWSIDTRDWETKNTDSTYKAITDVFNKGYNLDGDIVLMHDLQESTPPAVEKICAYLDEMGYQFVTVSELAYYRGVTMQSGQIYSSFYPYY